MFKKIKTPCYICEEELLEKNLKILLHVKQKSGAKILLALKGFAFYHLEPLVSRYLDGCSASGLMQHLGHFTRFCVKASRNDCMFWNSKNAIHHGG